MIDITKLKEKDIGRWVEYQDYTGTCKEKGRLKSWNNKYIFVVYKSNNNWSKFRDYTGVATKPEDLTFL